MSDLQEAISMENGQLRESLAEYAHNAWSGWMDYLFSERGGKTNEDGSFTIHPDQVKRWRRQVLTPYKKLSDEEKASDRKEAHKILNRVRGMLALQGWEVNRVHDK